MKLLVSSILICLSVSDFAQTKSVGINTNKPDTSAILDVSADPPPNVTATSKKGFLPPKVQLQSITDKTTIPNPAKGLLVYNIEDNGTFPNDVTANKFYYWDGDSWERLVFTSVVEEAVKPRVFYVEGTDKQTFTDRDMNSVKDVVPNDQLVTFANPVINVKNIITLQADSSFLINVTGLYDFAAFVNYNPMATTVGVAPAGSPFPAASYQKRAFLNLKIQKKNGANWENTIGSRTAWGEDGSQLKTAILLSTPLSLVKGDVIRVVIANPFDSTATDNHCGGGNSYIGNDVNNNIPTSKGFRAQLLDFNVK